MNIWGVTDKGVVRQQNQDDFHIELTQPDVALGIVCDGMGGARAGNVASRLAVDTFLDTARERSVDQWRADPEALLNFGAEQANQAVHFRAGIDAECRGMGTTMVAVLVMAGVLLAMVRIFGPSGAWGDSNTTYFDALGRIPAITVLTLCLAAFAWLALLLMAKQPASVRFQPPILVVIAGLFVVVVRAQLGDAPNALLDSIVQLNDPFAHLLFWSAIAAACTLLPLSENRIVGIAGLAYAAASVVWVVFLRGSAVVETTVILVVVALVMNRSWLSSLARGRGRGRQVAEGALDDEAAGDTASRLTQSIVERCQEVAAAYALSPRETEVFTLLAQGRTCSFVQDELVLAESTVKTHMSHIYGKLGVGGRQEMMDLLLDETKGKDDA